MWDSEKIRLTLLRYYLRCSQSMQLCISVSSCVSNYIRIIVLDIRHTIVSHPSRVFSPFSVTICFRSLVFFFISYLLSICSTVVLCVSSGGRGSAVMKGDWTELHKCRSLYPAQSTRLLIPLWGRYSIGSIVQVTTVIAMKTQRNISTSLSYVVLPAVK